MFFDHQISILEWSLKDHVTLKTEVMAAKNSAFQLLNSFFKIQHFKIYLNRKQFTI